MASSPSELTTRSSCRSAMSKCVSHHLHATVAVAALAVVAVAAYAFSKPSDPTRALKRRRQPRPRTTADSNKIVFISWIPTAEWPEKSPFMCKVATALRAANVDFEIQKLECKDDLPTHKVPVVHYRGEVLTDSHFIIKRLIKDGILPDWDASLSPEQRAVAEALRVSIEHIIYFGIVRERWGDDSRWPVVRKNYFGSYLSWPMIAILPDYLVRPGMLQQLYATGVSRYSNDQWHSLLTDSFSSLSTILDSKPFLFGDKPSTVDFSAFALLACILYNENLNPDVVAVAKQYTNLVKYTDRLRSLWIPADVYKS